MLSLVNIKADSTLKILIIFFLKKEKAMKDLKKKEGFLVPVNDLRWKPHHQALRFKTTNELEDLGGRIIGQDSAVDAIKFGAKIRKLGYNILAIGHHEMGRTTTVKTLLERIEKEEKNKKLQDICLVFDYESKTKLRPLYFEAGEGKKFQIAVEDFLNYLLDEIDLFENDIENKILEKEAEIEKIVKEKGAEMGFVVEKTRTPDGVSKYTFFVNYEEQRIAPAIAKEYFGEKEALKIEGKLQDLNKFIQEQYELFKNSLNNKESYSKKLAKFKNEKIREIANLFFEDSEHPGVHGFINWMVEDIKDNFDELFSDTQPPPSNNMFLLGKEETDPFDIYKVDILVNNEGNTRPIIFANNPDYADMFGGVIGNDSFKNSKNLPDIAQGKIHQAHCGFLVIYMNSFNYYTWNTLKEILISGKHEIRRIDPIHMGPSLERLTTPIGLDIKVIIIADPEVFYYLNDQDDDINKIFEIKAYFASSMDLEKNNIKQFTRLIKEITLKENTKPLNREAVVLLLQESIRIAGMRRISTAFSQIRKIIIEADVCTKENVITEKDIKKVFQSRDFRMDVLRRSERQMIKKELLLLNTNGEKIGEMNALAIYELPGHSFGSVSKVITTTGMGTRGIINIEKAAGFSGGYYDKAIDIISGYLHDKFAQDFPLVMNASISFEQHYSRIDGDSASLVDTITLLSSLSEVSIDQGVAITGSMNKKGEVQPIGGVNEKIEGFFDVCKLKGLTGTQGVIIPKSNVIDLMLREDVVEAVYNKKFHIYAVKTIEEAIFIAMDMDAGNKNQENDYEINTVYRKTKDKLENYYKKSIKK